MSSRIWSSIFPFKFLLILALFQNCCGLLCWDCDSVQQPTCADSFQVDTVALVNCSHKLRRNHPDTSKFICKKIMERKSGENRIYRHCGLLNSESPLRCANMTGKDQDFTIYCECNRDGCNTAPKLFGYSIWSTTMYALLITTAAAKF